MANNDEFGFDDVAAAFRPEVKKDEAVKKVVEAVVPPPQVAKPVATKPVTPNVAMPPLPQVNPADVAAAVPQPAMPEMPAIENPIFNPNFQKAAGLSVLPAVVGGAALGVASALAGSKIVKSIKERSMSQSTGVPSVDNNTPPPPNPVQQAQQRLADTQKAMEAKGPAPAPQAPAAQTPQAPAIVQPPAGQPVVPSVTQAVETGQSPTKSIQADIAPMVDEAVAPPAEKSVKTRVRRTAEQIAADKAALEASAPPGFRATYKKGSGEMGPGAYNWLHNLMGQEQAIKYWEEAVGKKNVPYSEFVKKYNEAAGEGITGPVKSVAPSVNAGSPKHIPEYIKGGAGIAPMAGMALMAPALLYAQQQAQQGNTAPAKELGFDVGGGALLAKILGGPAALAAALGLSSKELSSGTLNSPEARALGVAPR
jgi:hypothetical protein